MSDDPAPEATPVRSRGCWGPLLLAMLLLGGFVWLTWREVHFAVLSSQLQSAPSYKKDIWMRRLAIDHGARAVPLLEATYEEALETEDTVLAYRVCDIARFTLGGLALEEPVPDELERALTPLLCRGVRHPDEVVHRSALRALSEVAGWGQGASEEPEPLDPETLGLAFVTFLQTGHEESVHLRFQIRGLLDLVEVPPEGLVEELCARLERWGNEGQDVDWLLNALQRFPQAHPRLVRELVPLLHPRLRHAGWRAGHEGWEPLPLDDFQVRKRLCELAGAPGASSEALLAGAIALQLHKAAVEEPLDDEALATIQRLCELSWESGGEGARLALRGLAAMATPERDPALPLLLEASAGSESELRWEAAWILAESLGRPAAPEHSGRWRTALRSLAEDDEPALAAFASEALKGE